MTVCIAAHCSKENCLILASDFMVSTGDMSADFGAFKQKAIGSYWMAVFAGDDISSMTPIIKSVRRSLRDKEDSLDNVTDAFVGAFAEELRLRTENEILRPIGYSHQEFKKVGLAQLGPETFSRIFYEVQQQRLDLQFLVAGFENREPYIFTVTSPGKVTHYSELAFWAIGSGQTNALGSLFNSQTNARFQGRDAVIYRVCEAKFNAENAIGVGPETSLTILNEDGTRITPGFTAVRALRPIWEKTRTKVVPPEATKAIREILQRENREDG